MIKLDKIAFTADIDSLRTLFQSGGKPAENDVEVELTSGLESMRSIAKKHGFKWTLFVIGNDLLSSQNVSLIKSMSDEGHEIACHSMTHPQEFRFLPYDEKIREIEDFDKITQEKLGIKAVAERLNQSKSSQNNLESFISQIFQGRSGAYRELRRQINQIK